MERFLVSIEKFLPRSEHEEWFRRLDLLDTGAMSETELVAQIADAARAQHEDVWNAVSSAPQLNLELLTHISERLTGEYRVGLLTNIPRGLLERILQERLKLFDPALVSSDLGLVKPDPAIFQYAIERAGCEIDRILFIDDSERNVLAAAALGIKSVLYVDNASLIEQLQTLR